MAKNKKTYKRVVREYEDSVTIENEMVDGYVDMKLPRKHHFENGAFITVFQNTIFEIVTKANLTKGEMKLLLYLLATTKIDNSVCVDSYILQKHLNMSKGNLSTHLTGLTERNIIIRKDGYRGGNVKHVPMELRINYDQLNYDLGYNGKIKEYKKKRLNHPQVDAVTTKEIAARKQPELFKQMDLEDSINEIKNEQNTDNIEF